jgi:hypothetical protein
MRAKVVGEARSAVSSATSFKACNSQMIMDLMDAVEREIKNEEVIFQGNFRNCRKVAFRIRRTDPEIGLGLQRKHARSQELARTQEHVTLEALHVDLDVIRARDCPLGEQPSRRRMGTIRHCSLLSTPNRPVDWRYIELAVGLAGLK